MFNVYLTLPQKRAVLNNRLQKLVRASVIAAVYVVLCLVLAPVSFGAVQLRVSEALALLPVLCPEAVAGVTVGCLLANLLFSTPLDALVGTLATLAAALATRRLRRLRFRGFALAASLPPVLFNAVLVGGLISFQTLGTAAPAAWLLNMASVGAGQLLSCGVLGVALVWAIEKNPPLRNLFGGISF